MKSSVEHLRDDLKAAMAETTNDILTKMTEQGRIVSMQATEVTEDKKHLEEAVVPYIRMFKRAIKSLESSDQQAISLNLECLSDAKKVLAILEEQARTQIARRKLAAQEMPGPKRVLDNQIDID